MTWLISMIGSGILNIYQISYINQEFNSTTPRSNRLCILDRITIKRKCQFSFKVTRPSPKDDTSVTKQTQTVDRISDLISLPLLLPMDVLVRLDHSLQWMRPTQTRRTITICCSVASPPGLCRILIDILIMIHKQPLVFRFIGCGTVKKCDSHLPKNLKVSINLSNYTTLLVPIKASRSHLQPTVSSAFFLFMIYLIRCSAAVVLRITDTHSLCVPN